MRRSHSNPLHGAQIEITGSGMLRQKSGEIQSFRKKREEEAKPVNIRNLVKEQRRKFLAQCEEENRFKEEQHAREKKIQKLRGSANNVIEEVSIEDDTS